MKNILANFSGQVLSRGEMKDVKGGKLIDIECKDGTILTCRGTSCSGNDYNPFTGQIGYCNCDDRSLQVCSLDIY